MQRLNADPLKYLVEEFNAAPSIELALELLPYAYPKLKAVDIQQTADVKVNITIGGTD